MIPASIRGNDRIILTWIHENRFTTPKLYGSKFSTTKHLGNLNHNLDRLVGLGLLNKTKRKSNDEPVYFLSEAALRKFSDEGWLLIKNPQPPKITWSNQGHDIRVIEMRIKLERELENVFWVSDFEMRSGIGPKTKVDFKNSTLDVVKWRYNRGMKKERFKKIPDAYFEATISGERIAFVLEYVHTEYSSRKYDEVIPRLVQGYSGSKKLLVFRNNAATVKNIKYLRNRIKDRQGWWAGSYERVIEMPFLEAFEDLSIQA